MIGDLMGMMGKLKETQTKVEATKQRLNSVYIDELSFDGLLKITVTGNRVIKSIDIDEQLLKDKEQLEDYFLTSAHFQISKSHYI